MQFVYMFAVLDYMHHGLFGVSGLPHIVSSTAQSLMPRPWSGEVLGYGLSTRP